MSTSVAQSTAVQSIADRASAYSIPGIVVDGNDFSAVAEASDEAVARAREGLGPTLVEAATYRFRGHSRSDRNRYRTKEEIQEWIERDPISRLSELLESHGVATRKEIEQLESGVDREIEDAIDFADKSPAPSAAELMRNVYARELA